jgi:hypothetical protein
LPTSSATSSAPDASKPSDRAPARLTVVVHEPGQYVFGRTVGLPLQTARKGPISAWRFRSTNRAGDESAVL